MIISLHMPKSGGSSFRELLQNHFKSGLQLDYGDHPIQKSINKRIKKADNNLFLIHLYKKYFYRLFKVKCIHGHFLPYKYSNLKNEQNSVFITWLRDPLDRLGSHYFYWKKLYNRKTDSTLQKKIIEENLSFEKFCFSDEIRNIYSQYLINFPIQNFDFIGITEYFNDDIKYFSDHYLNNDGFEIPFSNVNPVRPVSYFNDKTLIKELKEFHADDYIIYNYALKIRKSRLDRGEKR